jgi:hypothetical protein
MQLLLTWQEVPQERERQLHPPLLLVSLLALRRQEQVCTALVSTPYCLAVHAQYIHVEARTMLSLLTVWDSPTQVVRRDFRIWNQVKPHVAMNRTLGTRNGSHE